MATKGKKISELPVAETLSGDEIIPFAKNGSNGGVSAGTLKEYVQDDTSDYVTKVDGKAVADGFLTPDGTSSQFLKANGSIDNTEYVSKETFDEQLANKQDELINSADITIEDSKLSVMDGAKRAVFIDLWNKACDMYGTYNADTGYFELNGLTDITYEEALVIYNLYYGHIYAVALNGSYINCTCRTLIPLYTANIISGQVCKCARAFLNSSLEIIRFVAVSANEPWGMFSGCKRLKYIYGEVSIRNQKNISDMFKFCYELQEVSLLGLSVDISFSDSPLLSHESLEYIVTKANKTTAITITVHPTVYAKLVGSEDAEYGDDNPADWHILVPLAAEKQISFITTE